jgi:DNA-binding transcriptional MerR regulator
MASYSIKDLEKLSGIKSHTLRIWEKRYNILQPKRTATNIRYYTNDDLRRILNIAILNGQGLKISHIASLSESEISEQVMHVSDAVSEFDDYIDGLLVSMIELNEVKFEKIISSSILKMGFESTIVKVVYPLLNKIGTFWQTGSITPAQEHFISNLLRQKIIVGIDSLSKEKPTSDKRFILFLNEGEQHELGLLFYHYLVKKRGHEVVYLGQSIPINDLQRVGEIVPPHYLLTAFVAKTSSRRIEDLLNRWTTIFPKAQLLVSGGQMNGYPHPVPKQIQTFPKIEDLIDFLDSV